MAQSAPSSRGRVQEKRQRNRKGLFGTDKARDARKRPFRCICAWHVLRQGAPFYLSTAEWLVSSLRREQESKRRRESIRRSLASSAGSLCIYPIVQRTPKSSKSPEQARS